MSIDRKIEIAQQAMPEDKRPEPFVTVLELAVRHGKLAVLEALTNLAEFDSEDPNFSDDDREADAILHTDLSMALEQYSLFFGYSEPEAQIDHGAGGMTDDDAQRLEQLKDAFKYGNEDTRDIALDEILRSEMSLGEKIPYLLSDLTQNDKQN
jgi:hypothetical protein